MMEKMCFVWQTLSEFSEIITHLNQSNMTKKINSNPLGYDETSEKKPSSIWQKVLNVIHIGYKVSNILRAVKWLIDFLP